MKVIYMILGFLLPFSIYADCLSLFQAPTLEKYAGISPKIKAFRNTVSDHFIIDAVDPLTKETYTIFVGDRYKYPSPMEGSTFYIRIVKNNKVIYDSQSGEEKDDTSLSDYDFPYIFTDPFTDFLGGHDTINDLEIIINDTTDVEITFKNSAGKTVQLTGNAA